MSMDQIIRGLFICLSMNSNLAWHFVLSEQGTKMSIFVIHIPWVKHFHMTSTFRGICMEHGVSQNHLVLFMFGKFACLDGKGKKKKLIKNKMCW